MIDILMERVLPGVVQLAVYITLGIVLGWALEALGLVRRLGRMAAPVTRAAGLPPVCATAFVTAFVSAKAAGGMLSAAHANGEISRRSLILGAVANSFPSALMHLRISGPVIVATLGAAGIAYVSFTVFNAVLVLGVVLAAGHLVSETTSNVQRPTSNAQGKHADSGHPDSLKAAALSPAGLTCKTGDRMTITRDDYGSRGDQSSTVIVARNRSPIFRPRIVRAAPWPLLVSENPAKRGLCRELCRELCRKLCRQSSQQSFQIPEKSAQRSEAGSRPDSGAHPTLAGRVQAAEASRPDWRVAWRRWRRLLPRVLLVAVPVYILVAYLNETGVFARLGKQMPPALEAALPPASLAVIAMQMTSTTRAAPVAREFLDSGELSPAAVFLALLTGYVLSLPVRVLRRNLPSAVSLYPGRNGLWITLISQGIRFAVALTAVTIGMLIQMRGAL